jgi:murein L,D-transpeptidase YafK
MLSVIQSKWFRRAACLSLAACAIAAAVRWWAPASSNPGATGGNDRMDDIRKRLTPDLKKALSAKGLSLGSPIFVRIFKEEKELEVWVAGSRGKFALFRTYPISTYGGKALGPKLAEGDGMAPEGFYTVGKSQLNPNSKFHLAFNIGYPNAYDRSHGRTGSYIMVHGSNVSIGCFAMTDAKIEEIYLLAEAALDGGQKAFAVHSFPFRMTSERLAREIKNPCADFWGNLREGYEWFEREKIPPVAGVQDKRYTFQAQR